MSRELRRNRDRNGGSYRPHAAHAMMLARRPRPKHRQFAVDAELHRPVQNYLDQHWSPEQIAHVMGAEHDMPIAPETIYQALYCPQHVLQRDAQATLRTLRRGNRRRGRFVVPLRMIEERPSDADDRSVPSHWEGDLVVGAFNWSAIGTLVERTTRYTILVHLAGLSRAHSRRDELMVILNELPGELRRSLPWDQGVEMCHHHEIAAATNMPVFLCHRGQPWQRPGNENTNGLLRDYSPKGTDLRAHTTNDLARVSGELNRRPRKTLGWYTPHDLFSSLHQKFV